MTDVIFVQVIFSSLRASSYDFENNEKYNMNLRFIEVWKVELECVKSFLLEFSLVIRKWISGTFFLVHPVVSNFL